MFWLALPHGKTYLVKFLIPVEYSQKSAFYVANYSECFFIKCAEWMILKGVRLTPTSVASE